jgi:hypothetical protein
MSNNNLKLTALANEFKATMNHAEEVFNEYMEVAMEQAMEEAINELSEVDKMILLLGLMTGAVEDKIVFDLEKLLAGEDEKEKCPYHMSDTFIKEISRLHQNANGNPSGSRMPVSVSKTFVKEIAALYGDNFVIHILG